MRKASMAENLSFLKFFDSYSEIRLKFLYRHSTLHKYDRPRKKELDLLSLNVISWAVVSGSERKPIRNKMPLILSKYNGDQLVATILQFLSNRTLDTLNGCLCGEVVDPLELPSDAIIKVQWNVYTKF